MATFRKRGKSWYAEVWKEGQRKSKSFPTKAHAQAWAVMMESQIQSGHNFAIEGKTFADLLAKYAEEVSPKKRGSKWERIRIEFVSRLPIGSVMLTELDESHVAKWRDDRLKEVSGSTVCRDWNLLSNACAVAVNEWKWIPTNPFSKVKRPQENEHRERRIGRDEIDRVIHCLGYDYDRKPETHSARVGAMFLFAIESGMRLKEMCRLTWDRVFLEERFLRIPVDSKTGKRDVPLSTEAIRIIEQVREVTRLFSTVFNLTEAQVDSLFRKARSKAMIVDLHFHDSKHEACTRLAKKVNVFDLARIVGTRDLKTLMVYYNKSAADIATDLD